MTFPPDIIEAVESGIRRADRRWMASPMHPHEDGDIVMIEAIKILEALATLNFFPPSAAVKEEREACAKVADSFFEKACDEDNIDGCAFSREIAEAIRSRSALATLMPSLTQRFPQQEGGIPPRRAKSSERS